MQMEDALVHLGISGSNVINAINVRQSLYMNIYLYRILFCYHIIYIHKYIYVHLDILGCLPPLEPDVSYGKECPLSDTGYDCLNDNTKYFTLMDAWTECGQVAHCGFIMLYMDNNYYLRRTSDPNYNGYAGGYFYPENCGI